MLPVHPAADLFDMMSTTELIHLGNDITENGLTVPIVILSSAPANYSDLRKHLRKGSGEIEFFLLDGRNRLEAGWLVGLDLFGMIANATLVAGIDPYSYVISTNIIRRHLTAEQRRELIAKVIKAKPELSDRQIAEQVKRDHKTVGAVRREMEDVGSIPHVAIRTDSKGRSQPATKPRKVEETRTSTEMISASLAPDIIEPDRKKLLKVARAVGEEEKQAAQFVTAKWRRDADALTIAKAILATLKYEPHSADIEPLRRALLEFLGKAPLDCARDAGLIE